MTRWEPDRAFWWLDSCLSPGGAWLHCLSESPLGLVSWQTEHPPEEFKTTQFPLLGHIYGARCDKDKVEYFPCSCRQNVFNHCFSPCVCVLWGTARTLHEVSLQESIRYAPGDAVEKWLNDLLCLDCLNITRIVSGCPLPEACELYPPGWCLPCGREGAMKQLHRRFRPFVSWAAALGSSLDFSA